MAIGDRIEVTELAQREFQRLGTVARIPAGGWVVSMGDQAGALVLDDRLEDVRHLSVPAEAQVAPGLDMFAVLTKKKLQFVSANGSVLHTIPQSAWPPWAGTTCAFDGRGRLWYARPGHERGKDVLVMVDPRSGITVAERRLGNDEGCFQFNPCPDPDSMLIEIACGQDGCFLYHAHFTGSEIQVQEYPFSDRIFSGGFSPDGQEFVTGAQDGDSVRVHAMPDGRVTGSLDSAALFGEDDLAAEEPDAVGYEAVFLDNDRLLVETRFHRLAVIDRPQMEVVGCLWPEGYELIPFDGSGQPVRNREAACSYEGNVGGFRCGAPGELLAVFDAGLVRVLDVSAALR